MPENSRQLQKSTYISLWFFLVDQQVFLLDNYCKNGTIL
jgi:hypothetical protein